MKKLRIGLFLLIFITLLTFCKSRYYVDLSKITFEEVKLKKIKNTDSLQLDFTLKIPPKSVGKKSIAVILPIIIDESDTLKFKTLTLAGEGNWDDCMNIPYNYPTIRNYRSKENIFGFNLKNATVLMQLTSIKKEKLFRKVAYQKESKQLLK